MQERPYVARAVACAIYIYYQIKLLFNRVVQISEIKKLKWFWTEARYDEQRDKILSSINELSENIELQTNEKTHYKELLTKDIYDVFICHASEDKEDFVRPLAVKLREKGISVWYDEFTLTLGDNLRRKIDYGLANSRYGIVVLSNDFFKKEWPQKELDGLVQREHRGKKVILPIWHGVSSDDILFYSPILSGKLAISTSKGLNAVVTSILQVVQKDKP